MTDKHNKLRYSVKALRVADEIWKELVALKKESGLSWNLFIKKLIDFYEKNLE